MNNLRARLLWKSRRFGALLILTTTAATWLWAHAGHAPLPTKGAQFDIDKGMIILTSDARNVLDIRTEEVKPRVVEEKVLAYATLVAPWQKHAFVSTRMPGRIIKLHVKPGEIVDGGQVLAEVQSLELEDMQLEILNLQTAMRLAAKVLKQVQTSSVQGVISAKDYRKAVYTHDQSVNALDVAKAKWMSLGLGAEKLAELLRDKNPKLLRSLPIVAPLSGTVIHADISLGKIVEPTDHLLEIMEFSSVWVKIGVLERDLHKIKVGQAVELRLSAYPDEIVSASVQVNSLYLDPVSHLGTVWAELKNTAGYAPRFLPGMHGQAQVILASPKKSLAVPSAALVSDGPERYVLVENAATAKASEFQKRSVTTGVEAEEWTQILGGEIFAGDRVVTTGLAELATFFVPGVLHLSPEAAKNINLVIEPVRPIIVEDVLEIQGAVDVPPDRRAFASAQLSGKIRAILIDRNQAVRKGDILAEVESLDLQKLQLDLLQVHLQVGLVEETLKQARLVENAIPQRQLWETESLRNELVSRRESLKRKLEVVGLSSEELKSIVDHKSVFDTFPVRAPRDGVVVQFDKALGQVIKVDEPLFEIHDLSQGYVQGFLSEGEVSSVRLGQKVRVRLISDPSFLAEGTVVRNGQTFGSESRVLSVWVELEEKSGRQLQHNLLARLTVIVNQPNAVLAVPLGALVREGTKSYVFVLDDKGIFERRLIVPGRNDDRYVEILGGLQPGEQVAVQGTSFLQTAFANIR